MPVNQKNLTPDELLTTTRAVRKRLDLFRPVEREVIEECVRIALQTPSGSNAQAWHFVIVTDQRLREELGKLYRRGSEAYFASTVSSVPKSSSRAPDDPKTESARARLRSSALYLVEHIHEVPVHVIPCYRGRPESLPHPAQAALWLSIGPAAWSFALAARARGLGTTFTTFHLAFEKEAARLLGIPYDEVMQAALLPLAYTKGFNFKPAQRKGISSVIHWNGW
jgi:nitroreductase